MAVVKFVLALAILAVPVVLAIGTWRGRVKLRCCTVDAQHDLRMGAVFPERPLGAAVTPAHDQPPSGEPHRRPDSSAIAP